jgi:hypothetical protein
MITTAKLSNVQLELLKMYANNVSDEDLTEIKQLLIAFFAEKITRNAEKTWQEKDYSDDFFMQQHLRASKKHLNLTKEGFSTYVEKPSFIY